ncbi:metalloregulator ArsR/SmtB family transcription factor [Kribbella italica]|uniref:ArsR family transcriptional regulator n=1 Tax=Kribbella italica TaxID=1540520 RepID=A0A7W9JEK3_9ACTN|nr:ArsR family transcriptional regulator [Kribbella italica]
MSTRRGAERVGAPSSGDSHQVTGVAIGRDEAERLAVVLKALSDPTRLQLLAMIEASPDGEACVNDLTEPLELSQPTISHHLKILVTAGILARDKRGLWSWYSIVPDQLQTLRALLPGPTFLR